MSPSEFSDGVDAKKQEVQVQYGWQKFWNPNSYVSPVAELERPSERTKVRNRIQKPSPRAEINRLREDLEGLSQMVEHPDAADKFSILEEKNSLT